MHQALVAFKPQTSTSSWWRRMRWSRLVFLTKSWGFFHMSSMKNHPEKKRNVGYLENLILTFGHRRIKFFFVSFLFFIFFVYYWMDANITGRQLRWELVSHCWLPSLCCWLPLAIGGLPHWVSSVAWKRWTKTEVLRMSPKKGPSQKEISSSNPWFSRDIRSFWGGKKPCPETKSWNEQLLHMDTFELGRG